MLDHFRVQLIWLRSLSKIRIAPRWGGLTAVATVMVTAQIQ